MKSVQAFAQFNLILISVCLLVLMGALLYRITSIYILKKQRFLLHRLEGHVFVKIMKVWFGVSMILMSLTLPFYVYIFLPTIRFLPDYLVHLFVATSLLLTLSESIHSFTVSKTLISDSGKKFILSLFLLFLFPVSVLLTLHIDDLFYYPEEGDSYRLELPVKGLWIAGHAGGSKLVNYHCAIRAQRFAMDVVKIGENGKFYEGEGKELTDFYAFNENIYSPVSGVVVNVVDSLPNIPLNFTPSRSVNPAGNHVVIEFEKDRFVFLAHLNQNSILVTNGQKVKEGDLIGKAGNSGNTSWPHLHMHIQDKPIIDNANATGYPYRFREINRKRWLTWKRLFNGYLVRNDLFRNVD